MACATKETSACLCTSCLNGCTSCSGGCSGDCDGSCSGDCRGCRGDCSGDCKGCSGTCRGSCKGCSGCSSCSGTCSGSCSGCTGSCTGSCTSCSGSCTGSCVGSCTGQCNTACTAEAQAELIANLGQNIAVGQPVRASDYTQLKAAIDGEYTRRGKAAPDALSPIPQPKGSVLLRTAQQVLEDVYGLDSMPEHDWRNLFSPGQVIPPSKWAPVIAYLKVLGTEIV